MGTCPPAALSRRLAPRQLQTQPDRHARAVGAVVIRASRRSVASRPAGGPPSRSWRHPLGPLLALLGFTAVVYGPMLNISFLGDDYVFLDETRAAGFADLWSFRNTDFGWFRPWSREVPFWFMQPPVGTPQGGFPLADGFLWFGARGAS